MSKEYIGREEAEKGIGRSMTKEYITKNRAKQFVCGHCNEVCSEEPCEPSDCDWMAFIDKEPAANVAPVVHGRWIEDHDYLKCPECSVMVKWDFTFFDIGDWNYCPNCGAYMMGKNNGKCE